jgi:NAD+ kinase
VLVLVVTKTTNFELHGAAIEAKVEQGRVSQDALSRLKQAHSEHYDTLAKLHQALERAGVCYDEISRETDRPPNVAYDAVITIGGDGTLLAASQKMSAGVRIYGIRSSASSVGFLCCAGPDEMSDLIRGIVSDTYPTVECARVKAQIYRVSDGRSEETAPVLNDFLYTNANPAATTRYRVSFGEDSETHRSSGIWVATAAGSTAAILAAGGQRRPLSDTAFQFRVRELYRLGHVVPHIDGGFFDPDRELLEIENRCPSAILALDGQHGSLDVAYGDRIRFLRAAPIRLGRPHAAG